MENVLGSEGAGGHIIIIANEEISTQSLQKVSLNFCILLCEEYIFVCLLRSP